MLSNNIVLFYIDIIMFLLNIMKKFLPRIILSKLLWNKKSIVFLTFWCSCLCFWSGSTYWLNTLLVNIRVVSYSSLCYPLWYYSVNSFWHCVFIIYYYFAQIHSCQDFWISEKPIELAKGYKGIKITHIYFLNILETK